MRSVCNEPNNTLISVFSTTEAVIVPQGNKYFAFLPHVGFLAAEYLGIIAVSRKDGVSDVSMRCYIILREGNAA